MKKVALGKPSTGSLPPGRFVPPNGRRKMLGLAGSQIAENGHRRVAGGSFRYTDPSGSIQ